MAEHGQVMLADIDLMLTQHGAGNHGATDLRHAAGAMVTVGGHLEQNGREMVDNANRLRRSLGYQ